MAKYKLLAPSLAYDIFGPMLVKFSILKFRLLKQGNISLDYA